jgi:hypothetical protein
MEDPTIHDKPMTAAEFYKGRNWGRGSYEEIKPKTKKRKK